MAGLSMGGETTYRFALHQPNTFAAIASLTAYLNHVDAAAMQRIKDLSVWAIQDANDTVFPIAWAQQPEAALKAAGNPIRFTSLSGHDHDVWTDTYSDPAFYDWRWQHQKQRIPRRLIIRSESKPTMSQVVFSKAA